MSLDALTDGELEALIVFNLGMIAGAAEKYRNRSTATNSENWPLRKAEILKAIERIDRILAFKRVA